jgi:hypothetical protein
MIPGLAAVLVRIRGDGMSESELTFAEAAAYVLLKNAELYRRLAQNNTQRLGSD